MLYISMNFDLSLVVSTSRFHAVRILHAISPFFPFLIIIFFFAAYAEGPDYSYVMDAPDPGAEVIEEDETPERVQQTTLDAMRTVAKTMRREVEELSSEEENVSRTGRASLDAWKRQKEMAKGRASQETKKGKKNDDDPLKAAGLSFDEFIANTEAQQHEANVVDEAVKYEMELETTTLRLKGMFAELFERVEHQRNIAESILRAKGLTWTDVIGHELPPASTFHSTPMPTPYSVDEAKASMVGDLIIILFCC